MPGNFDFSVLISQVPRVQKIHGDIQQGPLSHQESLQREVEKKQERAQKEVESSSKGSGSDKVADNKQGGGNKKESKKKKKNKKQEQKEKKLRDVSETGGLVDIEV